MSGMGPPHAVSLEQFHVSDSSLVGAKRDRTVRCHFVRVINIHTIRLRSVRLHSQHQGEYEIVSDGNGGAQAGVSVWKTTPNDGDSGGDKYMCVSSS